MSKTQGMAIWTVCSLIFGVLILNSTIIGAQGESAEQSQLAHGYQKFKGCNNCHTVTDPKIEADKHWVDLVLTTAWAGGITPKTIPGREAMVAYLNSNETKRPLLISEEYYPEKNQMVGLLEVPNTSGSVHLRTIPQHEEEVEKDVRLYWTESTSGSVLRIPVGDYKIIGFRYYKEDETGKLWTISATGKRVKFGNLEIGVDQKSTFNIPSEMWVGVKPKCIPAKQKVVVFLACKTEENGSRMTVSKEGVVAPATYTIFDQSGEAIQEGDFTYGWGAIVASWQYENGIMPLELTVSAEIDCGPFVTHEFLNAKVEEVKKKKKK